MRDLLTLKQTVYGLFGWKKRDDKWDDIVRLFSFNEI